jgi:hypothetical protein
MNFAASQSIATTTGQNDSGLFEVNFDDARYLPFEGAGLISTWEIDMPLDCNAFDFETIADVIINLRYTARYGGDTLRDLARKSAVLPARPIQLPPAAISPLPTQNDLQRSFSLKHEFSAEWYRFIRPADATTSQSIQIALGVERFPYQYRGRKIRITSVELLLMFNDLHDPTTFKVDGTPLGDYRAGTPLKLSLLPPSGAAVAATLISTPGLLAGTPFAALPLATGSPPGLGAWLLSAQGSDIQAIAPTLWTKVTSGGTDYYHLNAEVVQDVFMLCHYSAAP